MLTPKDNSSSFFIFASIDIKNLVVSDVNEVLSLVSEDLPPLGVSAPDLEVLRFS
jgi:hypothetical protein